jgi:hypothetical protein
MEVSKSSNSSSSSTQMLQSYARGLAASSTCLVVFQAKATIDFSPAVQRQLRRSHTFVTLPHSES